MKKNQGFTLVEILIASVILTLVSIAAFQMMTKSRESAEITTKKSLMTSALRMTLDAIKKDFHKVQVCDSINSSYGPDTSTTGSIGNLFYVKISGKFSRVTGSYKIELSQDGNALTGPCKKAVYELDKIKGILKRNGRVIADNVKEFILTNDVNLDGNIDIETENEAKIFVKLTLFQKFKDKKIKMEQSQVVTSPGILSVIKNSSKSLQSRADDF
ncbi:prepilin-type N-terminal cleavage/methylation domain-containing protein [bacterium]|nr:prepilin-type N-terminal cleavage/methylation domain-containing protein [bacterium]